MERDVMAAASAVLFDIDGTLVDSTYHHALAWHRAFATHGVDVPMWRIHRSIGMGGDRLVAEVAGEEVESRLGDLLREAWHSEYVPLRTEVRPLPGARDVLAHLHRSGFRMALASSGDPQFSREAVDLLGAADLVDALTTSEDVEASKPEPDLIATTLGRLDRVERAVFVGDTVYDVESAARAGLSCLALRSGGVSTGELVEAGASMVVDSPIELLGVRWEDHFAAVSQ